MRDLVVSRFWSAISNHSTKFDKIGMVGGSLGDPELVFFPDAIVTTIGIEDSDIHLDLNATPPKPNSQIQFDLCICSQVLEHVYNHSAFFENLSAITKSGGLIWLAAPASNFVHGSPDYYSAGFTDEYLARNISLQGFEILEVGQIASMKNYLARHALGLWLDAKSSSFPLRAVFGERPLAKESSFLRILGTLSRRLVPLLVLSLFPERTDSRWAVESYVLARKF